ncbi:hypothetical protein V5O48_004387 [Marasmius crinis-equi]|uniref:Uncharacterized protein n=1 Tax=Marasmius crinis-equi TaxID=585013 RepID=A0ABR3FQE8_9AGAR
MRVKQFWTYVPLPAQAKLVWERITFSRLTTAYFAFSVIHCIIQLGLQINAFAINANADKFLTSISAQAGAANQGIPALGEDDLKLCKNVAHDLSTDGCDTVWSSKPRAAMDMAVSRPSLSTVTVAATTSAFTNSISSSSSSTRASSATSSSSEVSSSSSSSSDSEVSTSSSSSRAQTSQAATTARSSSSSQQEQTTSTTSSTVAVPTINNGSSKKDDENELESDDEDSDSDSDDEESDSDSDDEKPKIVLSKSTRSLSKRHPWPGEANKMITVTLNGGGFNNKKLDLPESCAWSLNWPVSMLGNTKREDVVFITFQIWVLGMSIVAILNESIPHIAASLLTHVLATAWSGFQIAHTANFRKNFSRVLTNGACQGVNLLPDYWKTRSVAEFTILAFNIVSLFISGYLTWKLLKLFGWQTFKRVGASLTINRLYKLVLVMSITLQLSMFFMGATVGLWIDNLFNGIAADFAWYIPLYKATAFATMILLVPWIIMGWMSIRKELRLLMAIFLFLSLCYLGGWSVMFLSDTFRWTFVTWMFFRLMAIASVFLTLTAFVLGVICRYNFGKGLPRYLSAQEPLPGDDFTPVYHTSDIEKVDFPSNEKPIPTFSAAFGRGLEVPTPSQMFPGRMSNGPRFFQRSAVPFESPRGSDGTLTPPQSVMTRDNRSDDSRNATLARSDSSGSSKSYNSLGSYYNYSGPQHTRSGSEETIGNGRRWVIE